MSPQRRDAGTEVADEEHRRVRLSAALGSYESMRAPANVPQNIYGGCTRPTDPFLSPFHFTAATPFMSFLSHMFPIRTAGIRTLRDAQGDLANS